MPVQFVGFTDNSNAANPTAGDWTLPSGWAPNDVGVFWWGTNKATKSITEPGTVTQLWDTDYDAGTVDSKLFIGYRFLQTGDSTFSWTAGSLVGSAAGWGVAVFRDVVTGTGPFEAEWGFPGYFTNTVNPNPPSTQVLSNGAAVVTIFSKITPSGIAATPPSGYTLCGDELVGGGAAYKLNLAGTPDGQTYEDPGTWSLDVSTSGVIWSGTLRPWVTTTQPWSSISRPGRV